MAGLWPLLYSIHLLRYKKKINSFIHLPIHQCPYFPTIYVMLLTQVTCSLTPIETQPSPIRLCPHNVVPIPLLEQYLEAGMLVIS